MKNNPNEPMDLTPGNAVLSVLSAVATTRSGTEAAKTKSSLSAFTTAGLMATAILPVASHRGRSEKNSMRIAISITCALICGCASSPKYDAEYWSSTTARYVDSPFAHSLSSLVERIEKGDLAAWGKFAAKSDGLDGEYSQTYSVGCSEILRRDPTFFLRRYLAGDPRVLIPARRGYGWSGHAGRSLLDEVYARRLFIASSDSERGRISDFIDQTATVATTPK